MTIELLIPAFFLVAALYAMVGHGGASGYLAIMALAALPPATLRPTALVLNLAVSAIATIHFARAGAFKGTWFWPFAFPAIPMAWWGGSMVLPGAVYHNLLGLVLLFAAVRLAMLPASCSTENTRLCPLWLKLASGAAIGWLSGAVGVGGGIFLSPLLVLSRWSDPRTAAGVSAPFILVNSIAGLAGASHSIANLPASWPWLLAATIAGGWFGSRWGARQISPESRRKLCIALAVVLALAAIKMLAKGLVGSDGRVGPALYLDNQMCGSAVATPTRSGATPLCPSPGESYSPFAAARAALITSRDSAESFSSA